MDASSPHQRALGFHVTRISCTAHRSDRSALSVYVFFFFCLVIIFSFHPVFSLFPLLLLLPLFIIEQQGFFLSRKKDQKLCVKCGLFLSAIGWQDLVRDWLASGGLLFPNACSLSLHYFFFSVGGLCCLCLISLHLPVAFGVPRTGSGLRQPRFKPAPEGSHLSWVSEGHDVDSDVTKKKHVCFLLFVMSIFCLRANLVRHPFPRLPCDFVRECIN